MVKLDDDARVALEANIDDFISKPKDTERAYSIALREQGIEPNLETILAYITGMLTGVVYGVYLWKYERLLKPDELKVLIGLLKRRAFELRLAFMDTRIET